MEIAIMVFFIKDIFMERVYINGKMEVLIKVSL